MNKPQNDLDALRHQTERIEEMQAYIAPLVKQARISGYTWEQIGIALGITKQSAQHKYGASSKPY